MSVIFPQAKPEGVIIILYYLFIEKHFKFNSSLQLTKKTLLN